MIRYQLVGGAVRDKLLGLPVKDRDWVVTGATPQAMLQRGFRAVGKDFPVFLHPETHEEYALARTERKTAAGYHGFQFHAAPEVTLAEDLQRRDLTINALAEDEQGQLIDPYGGLQDLQQRVLRHVSPAFAEDPVRILRVARFAARFAPLGFRIAPETLQLMRAMTANGEVDALVPERVWQETVRALAEASPPTFITTLRDCGALAKLFPEIDRLFGIPQTPRHHPEIDTGIHTLMVLERATALTEDTRIRFAALVHDLGKGTTPPQEWPQHIGHEERSAKLITQLCQRYRVPTDYRQLAELTGRQHLRVHRSLELRANTIVKLLNETDALRKPERFQQLLLACQADAQGRAGSENKPYPQRAYLQQMLQACQAVAVKPVIEAGFQGMQIREQLHQLRVTAVGQHMKQYRQNLESPAAAAGQEAAQRPLPD
ncbi:MAG: multifunctional CCA addition/repair protein [Thiolinea sp.]